MTTITVHESAKSSHESTAVAGLVGVIGEEKFGPAFAQFLHRLCGADHFAAFRMGHGELRQVVASCVDPGLTARDRIDCYVNQGWWKQDPAMTAAQRCATAQVPSIIRADFSDDGYDAIRPTVYPRVRDRLLLCGTVADSAFGLSILRADPHAPFATEAIESVSGCAELLVTLLAKHSDICQTRPNVAQALTALDEIESCLVATSDLPRREAEVSARILYGMSSVGIALDLAVSEETVKTYRKRAYQRLAIGSERELLTWYLARWSHWRGHRFEMKAARAVH